MPADAKKQAETGDAKKQPERRLISLEELAKHDSEKDCWVAIHGLVINVDKKLQNEHPGGPEVGGCGRAIVKH